MFQPRLRSPLLWLGVCAVVIGIFLRLQFFGQIPVSLYWDEMAIWNDALSVAQTGRDTHGRVWNQALYISYGDFKMPAYIWLTAGVARFVSDPLIGARLVSLAAGISLLGTLPWLAWQLQLLFRSSTQSSESAGDFPLVTALLLAVTPAALHFSRVGFEAHLGLASVVASLGIAVWALRQKKAWLIPTGLVVASALGAFATYSYYSVRFVWPVVMMWLVGVGCFKHFSRRLRLVSLVAGVAALVMWIVLLIPLSQADFATEAERFRLSTPSILNDETTPHRVNLWRWSTGNTILSRVIFTPRIEQAKQLWQHELSFTQYEFLFQRGDGKLRHGTGMTGVLWWWMAPLLVLGVFALWRRHPLWAATLTLWWLVGVLPGAVPNDVPHTLRSLNALPALVLFSAYGGTLLVQWVRNQSGKAQMRTGVAVAVVTVMLMVLSVFQWIGQQPLYAQNSAEDWQDGYQNLATYLSQVHDQYPQVVVEVFDDRFFLYYQPVSGYSWSEIQTMPTQSFKRTEFGNIRLQSAQPLVTAPLGSLIILQGGADLPAEYEIKKLILNSRGEEVFRAVVAPQI